MTTPTLTNNPQTQQVMSPIVAIPSSSILTKEEQLNATNYLTWAYKMECIFVDQGLWRHVNGHDWEDAEKYDATLIKAETGTGSQDTVTTTMKPEWLATDNRARCILGRNVSDAQLHHVRRSVTANGAWRKLKELHQSRSLVRKTQLTRELQACRLKEGGNVEEYLENINRIVDEMSAVDLEPKETEIAFAILSGLPQSYSALIMGIEGGGQKITQEMVVALIRNEALRRNQNPSLGVYQKDSAMGAQTGSKRNNEGQKKKGKCFHCGKEGHYKSECRAYKAEKAAGRANKFAKTDSAKGAVEDAMVMFIDEEYLERPMEVGGNKAFKDDTHLANATDVSDRARHHP